MIPVLRNEIDPKTLAALLPCRLYPFLHLLKLPKHIDLDSNVTSNQGPHRSRSENIKQGWPLTRPGGPTTTLSFGGGTAGCVLASRLLERQPILSILVIEAGGDVTNHPHVYKPLEAAHLHFSDIAFKYLYRPAETSRQQASLCVWCQSTFGCYCYKRKYGSTDSV